MSYYPGVFPIHFDTLHPYSAGVTPVENVNIDEVRRAMYGAFTGIAIDGTITPNVDYTEGGTNITITGDSVVRESRVRAGQHRLYPLIGEAPPSLGSETPIFVDDAAGTSYADVSTSTETDTPPGSTSSIQLAITRSSVDFIWRTHFGFLRDDRAIGLYFAAGVFNNASNYAAMWIYAPVAGASPEDFYGFPLQPADNPPDSYTAIAEADAGTLLGVTLKKKGWKRTVARASGVEEYTPGISLAET